MARRYILGEAVRNCANTQLRGNNRRAGQKIEWVSAKLRAANTRAGDPFIRREYRKGWKLA
jgi:hypothetical protein